MKKFVFGLLLFLATWWIFYGSPIAYLSDSAYSMLMDEAILHHGTPNMIAYRVPRGSGNGFRDGYPWQLAMLKGRLLYMWPWGAPLLSLPAVAVLNATGIEVAPKHVYDAANEVRMQKIVSTFLCAIGVWLLYEIAIQFIPVGWSLAIAIGAGFGTQIWSSLSRSLWGQTWYVLIISLAILLLVRRNIRPVLLATLLAWAAFVRPQALPTIIIVGVYVLVKCDSNWSRACYVATGVLWSLTLAFMMLFFTDHLLASAYRSTALFAFRHGFLQRLDGILFSPSRGLLIFMPIVLIPFYLTVRYWHVLPKRDLAVLALAAITPTIAMLASYVIWWIGYNYGPRDLADIVPWLVLLAILGIRAFLDDPHLSMQESSAVISIAVVLLTISILMNAPGALSASATKWNEVPPLEYHPERLWDWEHPQWLAWAQSR